MQRKKRNDLEEVLQEARRSFMERSKVTSPHLRLWEIATQVQQYIEAVRRANAPRSLSGDPVRDPKKREALRRHREAHFSICKPDIGVGLMMVKLSNLDCTSVFGDTLFWGINSFEWDVELWQPLERWALAGFNMLFAGMKKPDWPRILSATEVKNWVEEGEAIKADLLERMVKLLPNGKFPIVDEKNRVIKWEEKEIRLKGKNFLLFACLAKAKGRVVEHEDICDALDYQQLKPTDDHAGYERRRADRLRKEIQRLREALKKSGAPELAEAIITEERGYALDVSGLLPLPKDK